MPKPLDPYLEGTLRHDRQYLELSTVPIITVSSSNKEDIKSFFGYLSDDTTPDVVFSRAHYSMAVGVAVQAWEGTTKETKKTAKIDPQLAWVVDPTNYVSHRDWSSIQLTEAIGKTIARQPFLKKLKDWVDSFGRKNLPILKSITPPLLYLTQNIHRPILSMHIAAGNILAAQGKTVVQVITDPHVREEYLDHAEKPTMTYCVFDENTKVEVLEKAAILEKKIDPDRVIVTGPPIDPRVRATRTKKRPWRNGPLNLCLTTGGLGTNKGELRHIIRQLLPELRKRPEPYRLVVYAGTHKDIFQMVERLAEEAHVAIDSLHHTSAKLRVIYHPQIVDANELLIKYGFSWADGFISKPSGDMAYDAIASGSFVLTLSEWGEWEHNIRETFEQRSLSRKAEIDHIVAQLEALTSTQSKAQSWVEQAMEHAQRLPPLFLNGSAKILQVYYQVVKKANLN